MEDWSNYECAGLISANSGKTLAAVIEVARALTGSDPFHKYPDRDGLCVAVGKDGKHIAKPMWRYLSKAGAFKMIRDEQTGLWRAYRPWDERDLARAAQSKPAPPILPPRWIKSIAWENKKEGQPSIVTLSTGWQLDFRSSMGKPGQGHAADLYWFDEEIIDDDWYPEASMRLLDKHGRFIWSATPQAATQALYDLSCRAADGDPLVDESLCLLLKNPHIAEQEKKDIISKLTPEEYRIRVEGEFRLASLKVYPEFHMSLLGVEPFEIPENWMRLLSVDPGKQVCAVLFAAIPPDSDQDHVYFYDELYIRNADAEMFGEQLHQKTKGHDHYVFLIDGHCARQSEVGSGKTVEGRYIDALIKHDIASTLQGHAFTYGSDDPKSGILAFRDWLRIRPDGTTKLRVFRERCPNLEWEMGRYQHKRIGGVVTDDVVKKNDHLSDAARYLAAFDPSYVPPPPRKKAMSFAVRWLKAKKDRRKQKREAMGEGHISLGPRSRK